jgi:hypothetical protein
MRGDMRKRKSTTKKPVTAWSPDAFPPVDPRGAQFRSCSDPNCPRCKRNRWIRRLTGGLAGYGG